MLTSLFSLFYITGEFHRFLHQGRAEKMWKKRLWLINNLTSKRCCIKSHQNNKQCIHDSHTKDGSAKSTWISSARFLSIWITLGFSSAAIKTRERQKGHVLAVKCIFSLVLHAMQFLPALGVSPITLVATLYPDLASNHLKNGQTYTEAHQTFCRRCPC